MSFEVAEARMREMAKVVETYLPKGWGFLLVATKFHDTEIDGKNTCYVSTCEREDVCVMLRSLLKRWEDGKGEF